MVTYRVLCKGDLHKEILLEELLTNEKIAKVIKSEYAKGFRNIALLSHDKDATLTLETKKELYSFEVEKNDFADILVLAEEHALNNKHIKKECDRIELVDLETL